MRLHVVTGCRDLLLPEPVPAAELAALIGPRLRPATAAWLEPDCGLLDHAFLLEAAGDRRVEVFAQALRDNFGSRFEPLMVLPDLLDAAAPAAGRHPAPALLRELWRLRPAAAMVLHALALPEGVDGGDGWAGDGGLVAPLARARLEALRAELAADGADVDAVLTEVGDRPGCAVFLRNAVAGQAAARAARSLAAEGLRTDPAVLPGSMARLLLAWHRAGMSPASPLGGRDLDRLSERMLRSLLAERPDAG